MVYLPTFDWSFMVNVCKYTIHGYYGPLISHFLISKKKHGHSKRNRQTEYSGSVYPPTLTLRQCCHVRKLKVEGRQIFAHPSDGRRLWEEMGHGRNPAITSWYGKYPLSSKDFKTSQVVSRISSINRSNEISPCSIGNTWKYTDSFRVHFPGSYILVDPGV